MKRLYPSSLLGQMLLLIGAALLVAQAVNFAFLLNEQQKLSLARSEGPAIVRFTQAAAVIAATAPRGRPLLLSAHRAGPAVAYRLVPQSGIDRQAMERNADIEERLQDSLREARVPVRAVRAASPRGVARMHWVRGPDHHIAQPRKRRRRPRPRHRQCGGARTRWKAGAGEPRGGRTERRLGPSKIAQ